MLEPLIKGVGVSSNMDEGLRNLKDGITSRNILERVIKKLGMSDAAQYESLIDGIRKKLDIKVGNPGRRGEKQICLLSHTLEAIRKE